VPTVLREVITLGRTLKRRAVDVLADFDRPGISNGPTEAINGRLEHLRGSALGFRNLTNYTARSLLETAGVQTPTTSSIMKSPICQPGRRAAGVAAPQPSVPPCCQRRCQTLTARTETSTWRAT
jgi:hypothetical protein